MASLFPGAVDNIDATKVNSTLQRNNHPPHHNAMAEAINAIESYLIGGTDPFSFGENYRFDQDLDEDVPLLWLGNWRSSPFGPNINAMLIMHGAYSNSDNLLGAWIGPVASVNGAIDTLTGIEVVLYTANTVTNITGAATVFNADIALSNAGTTARAVGYQAALFTVNAPLLGQTITFAAGFSYITAPVGAGAITASYGAHLQAPAGATTNVHLFLGRAGVDAPITPGTYAIASESLEVSYIKGPVALGSVLYPGDFITTQVVTGIYAGNGAPGAGEGSNGDFYFQGDGTVAGNTVVYHKQGGAWVALVTA